MTDHDPAPAETPAGPPPTTPVIISILLLAALWAGITAYHKFVAPPAGARPGAHADPAHAPPATPPAGAHAEPGKEGAHPEYWAVLPFVLLLAAIAIFPLWGLTYHWWESNASKLLVAGVLAAITLFYYIVVYSEGGAAKTFNHLLHHTLLGEYFPFIILLFSLFTIAGGIRISGDMAATPTINSIFLLVGALLASFIGTTGAAMLLIRPLLETNSQRKNVAHTVVFFIFAVCNCGGSLLPIGDPPFFLGYLEGVDFMWTFYKLWAPWLLTNGLIIAVYYCWDTFFSYPAEAPEDLAKDKARAGGLSFQGLALNGLLLLGVVLAVAFLDPNKFFPGTDWKPLVYLREVVMLGLVASSLAFGSTEVREKNGFNYNAILEVAALFIGIFITMRPALDILSVKGPSLGVESPLAFFWATGALSSVLDNAPTYKVFLEAAAAQINQAYPQPPPPPGEVPLTPIQWFIALLSTTGEGGTMANGKLMGVSLGAVFLGAMTYIGNGPNFMVKSIAEESGVKMPSFFGYVFLFSFPVLLPIFGIVSLIFLKLLV